MRLRSQELSDSLERNGLLPIYYVTGDEPLQLNEAVDAIRRAARERGVQERIVLNVGVGFDWRTLLEEETNLSLFSDRRLIELRLGTHKPGGTGGAILSTYAATTAANILLISGERIDKKGRQTKWFKALDRAGAIVQIWPIEAAKLPDWIARRVQHSNKRIDHEAAQVIADHVEGNMLAADQEIKKLCLLIKHDRITAADVMNLINDCTRFEVFSLIECAYAGKSRRVVRMLNGLRSEGVDVMAVYGPMAWDFRRLCRIAYGYHQGRPLNTLFPQHHVFGEQQKPAIRLILKRHPIKKLYDFLRWINALDTLIKSSDKVLAWDALLAVLLALSGRETTLTALRYA